MRTLTLKDLETAPKDALVKYWCAEDDIVWYEPLQRYSQRLIP